jgi:hypothetical protein
MMVHLLFCMGIGMGTPPRLHVRGGCAWCISIGTAFTYRDSNALRGNSNEICGMSNDLRGNTYPCRGNSNAGNTRSILRCSALPPMTRRCASCSVTNQDVVDRQADNQNFVDRSERGDAHHVQ